MKELTVKQRFKLWRNRKWEFWEEVFDAMLLEEPLFKFPKRNKYYLKNICRKINKITFRQKLDNYIWWYFSKEAKCYRASWSIRKDFMPKWNHFKFKELHRIADKIQGTTLYFDRDYVIEDYKPGTDFIYFDKPPVIKADRFNRIVEVLRPEPADEN